MKFNLRNNIAFTALLFVVYCQGQQKSFQSFDGIKIAYSDEGKGFPVLLVHGFINTGASWNKTMLKKELLAKGYRVIAPDLRGNGASDKPQKEDAYKHDAELKDLLALIAHLGLQEYDAVGYSRGSIVLAKLLTQESRIKKAVLGGMGVHFTDPNWDRRLLFMEAFAGNITPETEGAVTYAKSIKADIRSLHLQQKYQPVTSKEALQKIKTKVLVLAGDEDKDNGAPSDLQRAIPKSVLQIVKGDHNGTYKTAEFSQAVIAFLKG
ncbi:alpha/beta fold hydrolase [Spongiimicrobium salis]|uniref:alpha/beta fold hydrolase n=1 Tax=Spongiimicrobium salis TaxID=1667022 RepID=UPI00374DD72F